MRTSQRILQMASHEIIPAYEGARLLMHFDGQKCRQYFTYLPGLASGIILGEDFFHPRRKDPRPRGWRMSTWLENTPSNISEEACDVDGACFAGKDRCLERGRYSSMIRQPQTLGRAYTGDGFCYTDDRTPNYRTHSSTFERGRELRIPLENGLLNTTDTGSSR